MTCLCSITTVLQSRIELRSPHNAVHSLTSIGVLFVIIAVLYVGMTYVNSRGIYKIANGLLTHLAPSCYMHVHVHESVISQYLYPPVNVRNGDLTFCVLFHLSGGVGGQWFMETHLFCCPNCQPHILAVTQNLQFHIA